MSGIRRKQQAPQEEMLKKTLTVRVSDSDLELIKQLCEKRQSKITQLIREGLAIIMRAEGIIPEPKTFHEECPELAGTKFFPWSDGKRGPKKESDLILFASDPFDDDTPSWAQVFYHYEHSRHLSVEEIGKLYGNGISSQSIVRHWKRYDRWRYGFPVDAKLQPFLHYTLVDQPRPRKGRKK